MEAEFREQINYWTLKDVIGFTATVTTLAQFFAGCFTVRRVQVAGTPGELSPVPFLMGFLGCTLWMSYGILIDDTTIRYTNVVGLLLNLFYVFVFLHFSVKKTHLSRLLLMSVTFLTAVLYYIMYLPEREIQRHQLGLVCVAVSLAACASPLVALKQVMLSRSTSMLPLPLIISMFVVCFQWWIYAILIEDAFMQFTNLCGTVLATIQLSLFLVYPYSPKSSTQTKH